MWDRARNHLELCFVLVDNAYETFDPNNYRTLVELKRRFNSGERTSELYQLIMGWSL